MTVVTKNYWSHLFLCKFTSLLFRENFCNLYNIALRMSTCRFTFHLLIRETFLYLIYYCTQNIKHKAFCLHSFRVNLHKY